MAFVKPDGNLESVDGIPLYELINKSRSQRDYLAWHIVHRIVDAALKQNKAIAIERLKDMPKGSKGDGSKRLRRRLQQSIYNMKSDLCCSLTTIITNPKSPFNG